MTHTLGPVPFALCGSGGEFVAATPAGSYDEVAAAASGLVLDAAWRLLPGMVAGKALSAAGVSGPCTATGG